MSYCIRTQRIKKSRKSHRCDYCERPIEVGTSYQLDIMTYEDEFYQWKSHLGCVHLIPHLGMGDYDEITAVNFYENVCALYYDFNPDTNPSFEEKLEFLYNHFNIQDEVDRRTNK